jgi:5-methylcytosine-specific restriction enzyme subunit McrC
MPTRRLSLAEYQTTSGVPLARAERDGLQALAPSIAITPTRGVEGQFDLTPGSWIGAIELPTLAIEIRPKVPLDRVFFLLAYTVNPRGWRETTFAYGTHDTLLETMINPFSIAVAAALRRGVLQGYRVEEEALLTIRGRIRFDEQTRRRFGRIPPVELVYDDYTEDIDANRLIKTALARLSRLRIRSRHARRALRRFDHALERVRTVEYDPRRLPEVIYTRLNAHYRQAVELAKLIIRGTTLELSHGRAYGAAFLIDMNQVFEDFVTVALREALRLDSATFPQNATRRSLWLDSGRRVRLRPDLSWWERGSCVFLGDVKYKRVQVAEIEHPDLYQLLAYTIATGLPGGLLVYAADEAAPVEHDVPLAGKRLRVSTLDLRGEPEEIIRRVGAIAGHVRRLRSDAYQLPESMPPALVGASHR